LRITRGRREVATFESKGPVRGSESFMAKDRTGRVGM